jgi:hypothetical protein
MVFNVIDGQRQMVNLYIWSVGFPIITSQIEKDKVARRGAHVFTEVDRHGKVPIFYERHVAVPVPHAFSYAGGVGCPMAYQLHL